MQNIVKSFAEIKLGSEIRGILLDLDDCLYIYTPCHRSALEAAKKYAENEIGEIADFAERYEVAKKTVKARMPYQAASHSRLLYFQALLESYRQAPPLISLALTMEEVYWDTFIKLMEPVPGLHNFLASCHKKRIKTIIVSDMTAQIQFRKLMALGINDLIDHIVTSEEAGVEKPSITIFELALKKAGLKKSEVIIIGDDIKRDGGGAKNLGVSWLQISHEQ